MSKPLYLGRPLAGPGNWELDGDQLVTHGVVLGMTGSGKTGLSVTLLEELVAQKVPLILIDPKGDLPNLGLVFPELEPSQFEPWIDGQQAQHSGRTPAELAGAAAEKMGSQLAEWGLNQTRMATLRDSMDLRIYTPGASGNPVNLLGRMSCPPGAQDNQELRGELITGTVGGLLSLVGVSGDPLRSPEHIVLAAILEQAWGQGQDLSLETLIMQLVDPPFKKVGVFPVDTFYPADKRMELAMRLNAVLASPSFAAWSQGDPLEPAAWIDGGAKVPVSVFYLAHLGDAERMFFVSLLLERLLAYSRSLSGTTSLRALLYFDEVAGYLPPHPLNPPSKRPLLTLMKQARAVGLGVVLATQNPVDIDYKGLANAGTWLIGRMQTAQDRERVADGLISAAAGVDRATLIGLFEQLKPRVFMVKGAGSERPELVQTRQTMSFLRGPLTRADLEKLQAAPALPAPAPRVQEVGSPQDGRLQALPGLVPKGFEQLFVDPRIVFAARLEGALEGFAEPARPDGKLVYRPALFGELHLRFNEGKGGFVHDERILRLYFPLDQGLPREALTVPFQDGDLLSEPPGPEALFPCLPTAFDEEPELKAAQKALVDEVFRNVTDTQWVHTKLKLYGAGGESREDFLKRLGRVIQDRVDAQCAALHEKYDRQVATLQERLSRKESEASLRENQAQGRHTEQLLSTGAAVLSFFTSNHRSLASALGRTLGGAVSKNRRSEDAKLRAEAAQEELQRVAEKLEQVRDQLADEVETIRLKEFAALDGIEERTVRLDRSDVRLSRFGVLWIPTTRRL